MRWQDATDTRLNAQMPECVLGRVDVFFILRHGHDLRRTDVGKALSGTTLVGQQSSAVRYDSVAQVTKDFRESLVDAA
ncbi:MAG: hypothetical protein AAF670_10610 [Planctomycetota bacterium]